MKANAIVTFCFEGGQKTVSEFCLSEAYSLQRGFTLSTTKCSLCLGGFTGGTLGLGQTICQTSPQMDLAVGDLGPGYCPVSGSLRTGFLVGGSWCPFPSDSSQSVGDILSCCILEREEVRGLYLFLSQVATSSLFSFTHIPPSDHSA